MATRSEMSPNSTSLDEIEFTIIDKISTNFQSSTYEYLRTYMFVPLCAPINFINKKNNLKNIN
jgi:hypothetical protein